MALKTWDGTQWVDTATAHQHDTYLQLIGGTMTGDIVLVGDPTLPLHPVTKQYADTIHGKQHVIDTVAPPTPNVGDVWVNPDFQPEGLYLPLDGSLPMTGDLDMGGNSITIGEGGPTDPQLIFEGAANQGLWGAGATIRWGSLGIQGGFLFERGLRIVDGTAAEPSLSFSSDGDTGMYRVGSNDLAFSAGGVRIVKFDAVGAVFGPASALGDPRLRTDGGSSAGSPGFTFQGDTDTGMFRAANNGISFSTGGFEGMHLGGGNGAFYLHGVPANHTTGTAANMNIATTSPGQVKRSTSARKYKTNIEDAPQLADLVLKPVTFHRDDDDMDFIGFIADDIAEQDARAGEFADGEVENYDLRAVVAILAAKVNRLENA